MSNSENTEKFRNTSIPFIFSRIVPAIAIVLFLLIGMAIFQVRHPKEAKVQQFNNWQEADAPFGLLSSGDSIYAPGISYQKFTPSFHFHSPWERAAIPRAEQFQAAMGSETWAYTYNAQPFDELNRKRGGKHSGDDINGIGGQNSDLGDPVFAVANGLVVYAGNPRPGWGNCVILAHRTSDGKIIHSMYAHLLRIHASYLQQVPRGGTLGTVGQADVGYLAHLHLEMRESDGVSPFLSGYPQLTQHDRLNPTAIISNYMAEGDNAYNPSTLNITQLNRILPEIEWDGDSAQLFMKYMNNAPTGDSE